MNGHAQDIGTNIIIDRISPESAHWRRAMALLRVLPMDTRHLRGRKELAPADFMVPLTTHKPGEGMVKTGKVSFAVRLRGQADFRGVIEAGDVLGMAAVVEAIQGALGSEINQASRRELAVSMQIESARRGEGSVAVAVLEAERRREHQLAFRALAEFQPMQILAANPIAFTQALRSAIARVEGGFSPVTPVGRTADLPLVA